MPDYKTMYLKLAGSVADAIELLIAAQRNAEIDFMEDQPAGVFATIGQENEPEA